MISSLSKAEITLQINLSPGDRQYAHLTIPALVARHEDIKRRLLVVDCCRPQKTKLIDNDIKYPLPTFLAQVEEIISLSEGFLKEGVVSEVIYLKPGDPIFKQLSLKYLNGAYDFTHSAGGTANMSYWAAMEIPETRYVIHFDADMLFYQKPGYHWYQEAVAYLQEEPGAIFAVPRLCPPVDGGWLDVPSLKEGRPFQSFTGYWMNDWFSTRLFLLDKARLERRLPLVKGWLKGELLLRKYLRRAYPFDPEIILAKSLWASKDRRVILKNSDAWALHPSEKGEAFLELLPHMLKRIADGKAPLQQLGVEDVILDSWRSSGS
jgi:hypothetical protein